MLFGAAIIIIINLFLITFIALGLKFFGEIDLSSFFFFFYHFINPNGVPPRTIFAN